MFSRKSDIILKHLCSFLFEKMPASNQEPGIFLWLLLEGERGKVGVFGLGIEAGAVFLHPGEVAVAENLRAGVIVLQTHQPTVASKYGQLSCQNTANCRVKIRPTGTFIAKK